MGVKHGSARTFAKGKTTKPKSYGEPEKAPFYRNAKSGKKPVGGKNRRASWA